MTSFTPQPHSFRRIILAAVMIAVPGLAAAQQNGGVALTLDDAVGRALAQNRDIAVERLNPQAFDLSIAALAATSTSYLVVQAQRDQANARIVELRALADYQKARVDFDRVQQTLLADAGISVAASASTPLVAN